MMKHDEIQWTEHTWLKNTLVRMSVLSMRLKTTLPELETWKEKDKFIMEEIQREKTFNHQEMKQINEVRMSLRVNTLADISSSDGKRILQAAYKAEAIRSCSGSRYKWPRTAENRRATRAKKKIMGKSLATYFFKDQRQFY